MLKILWVCDRQVVAQLHHRHVFSRAVNLPSFPDRKACRVRMRDGDEIIVIAQGPECSWSETDNQVFRPRHWPARILLLRTSLAIAAKDCVKPGHGTAVACVGHRRAGSILAIG